MQNETAKENLLRQIREYRPYNEQEERDRAILLKWMESGCDILTRENEIAHLTASAWVVSPDRKQVLMASIFTIPGHGSAATRTEMRIFAAWR